MIDYISIECLKNKEILEEIYKNKNKNYYYSDDFSNEFYVKAAYEGFISISYEEKENFVILPEIQFDYAVLYFENLHIPKKVKKLLKENEFEFKINKNYEEVIEQIAKIHKDSWIIKKYKQTLLNLKEYKSEIDFKIFTSEVYSKDKELVAGEIGYKIGATYTSLSGFCKKDKSFNNYGKLQLVLLAKYLQKNSYKFWNLGHPYMKYKFDLGAEILNREEFLNIWQEARGLNI
ncbi:hypothetical protein CP985_07045 [Malaciobacter mytili LMG 24559]|uniref:Leucyl, phenylalanyl-tRNA-protein transferase n=1 Tax=Malaciobacter mytili LMG 24559 TaxID=1032238 RepID=A0AAX2AHN4_9BACT|nr:hypothetical protein CP985_07045 [Malaciobacter mytili LMG 24559]